MNTNPKAVRPSLIVKDLRDSIANKRIEGEINSLLSSSSNYNQPLSLSPSNSFPTFKSIVIHLKAAAIQRKFTLFNQLKVENLKLTCLFGKDTTHLSGQGNCGAYWVIKEVELGEWKVVESRLNHNHSVEKVSIVGVEEKDIVGVAKESKDSLSIDESQIELKEVMTVNSIVPNLLTIPFTPNLKKFRTHDNIQEEVLSLFNSSQQLPFPTISNQISFSNHDEFRIYISASAQRFGFNLHISDATTLDTKKSFKMKCAKNHSRIPEKIRCKFRIVVELVRLGNGTSGWSVITENQHSGPACIGVNENLKKSASIAVISSNANAPSTSQARSSTFTSTSTSTIPPSTTKSPSIRIPAPFHRLPIPTCPTISTTNTSSLSRENFPPPNLYPSINSSNLLPAPHYIQPSHPHSLKFHPPLPPQSISNNNNKKYFEPFTWNMFDLNSNQFQNQSSRRILPQSKSIPSLPRSRFSYPSIPTLSNRPSILPPQTSLSKVESSKPYTPYIVSNQNSTPPIQSSPPPPPPPSTQISTPSPESSNISKRSIEEIVLSLSNTPIATKIEPIVSISEPPRKRKKIVESSITPPIRSNDTPPSLSSTSNTFISNAEVIKSYTPITTPITKQELSNFIYSLSPTLIPFTELLYSKSGLKSMESLLYLLVLSSNQFDYFLEELEKNVEVEKNEEGEEEEGRGRLKFIQKIILKKKLEEIRIRLEI